MRHSKVINEQSNLKELILQALQTGDFTFYYQPQICLANNEIHGFEVLVRCNNKSGLKLNTDEFINVIEDIGKAEELNHLVLKTFLEYISNYDPKYKKKFAINISTAVSDLISHIKQLIQVVKSAKLSKNIQIEFEFTESQFIDDDVWSKLNLPEMYTELKAANILVGLDDFGVKYSALKRLLDYKFNTIKIDLIFVQALETSKIKLAQVLIKAVIDLAKLMDADVIAEGAASNIQIDLLKSLGCNYVQSNFYYSPMSKAEMLKHLV